MFINQGGTAGYPVPIGIGCPFFNFQALAENFLCKIVKFLYHAIPRLGAYKQFLAQNGKILCGIILVYSD